MKKGRVLQYRILPIFLGGDKMLKIDIPYRFSRYCKVFQRENIVALYHSLKMRVIYLEKSIFSKLETLNVGITPTMLLKTLKRETSQKSVKEALAVLEEAGLIAPVLEKEDLLEKIQEHFLGKPRIEMMYLLITDQCNLRCSYCYLNTYTPIDFKFRKMNFSTARKAVDLFVDVAGKYGSDDVKVITLYGGEPLSNWPVFKDVVEYVNFLRTSNGVAKRIKLITITNGTLITPEIASFLKKNNVSMGISIDGTPSAVNAHRKFVNGKGSFREIIRGYRYLVNAGVETGISCTLIPENLENFPETLRYLLDEIKIKDSVSFNLLHHNSAILVTTDYLLKASRAIIDAFELFRKRGIYEERMMRKLTPFVEKRATLYDCGGCGQQLAVSPDGKVGTCHDCLRADKYIATTVDDRNFNPLENKIFVEWSKRSPFGMPQCYDCPAIAICGGGCPVDAEFQYGSIWSVDTRFCFHSKSALEWIIWDQYSQMGQKLLQ